MRAAASLGPRLLRWMATITAILALSACGGAIRTEPFHDFVDSTTELRDGTDQLIGLQYEQARERFLLEVAAGDSVSGELVQKLLLENIPDQPYAWTVPEGPPLFLATRQFRDSARELNDTLVRYAELLAELAGVGSMSPEEFESTAQGLNTQLRETVGEESGSGIAIFSVAATELFQQYLRSQSREKLEAAMLANQENLVEVSDHLRAGMRLAAQHAFAEYAPRSLELALQLTPDSPLGPDQKQKRVVQLLELNETLIDRLETLQRLDDSYRAIPAVNRELAASLNQKESAMHAIRRIRDDAKRLRELYESLQEGDENAPDETVAAATTEENGE